MNKVFLILMFVITNVFSANSCDCDYSRDFMSIVKYDENVALIALVKVIEHPTTELMIVEIIEDFSDRNEHMPSKINVYGDTGSLCRPHVSEFKQGNYYLMALELDNLDFFELRNDRDFKLDYAISNCGEYWLSYNKSEGKLEGRIENDCSEILLEQFRQAIKK